MRLLIALQSIRPWAKETTDMPNTAATTKQWRRKELMANKTYS
jgi:hypothetical protein